MIDQTPAPVKTDRLIVSQPQAIKQAAFDYTRKHNLAVTPSNGKQPIIKNWPTERLPEEAYENYFKGGFNICIICGELSGGLLVIDFDSQELFEKWAAEDPDRLKTPYVRTGKQGFHVYYKILKGEPMPGCPKFYYMGDAGELRGQGGLVVAPPSIHPETKKPYEWVIPLDTIQIKIIKNIAELGLTTERGGDGKNKPSNVVRVSDIDAYRSAAWEKSKEKIMSATKGTRNDTIKEVVAGLAQLGLGLPEITETFLPLAEALYDRGDREDSQSLKGLNSVFESAYNFGLKNSKKIVARKKTELAKNALDLIEDRLKANYEFRHHSILNRYEWQRRSEGNPLPWQQITDRDYNALWVELCKYFGYNIPFHNLVRIIESKFSQSFNPVDDYFSSLPAWDGNNYIDVLVSLVLAKDSALFKKYLTRWLVACVATMRGRGINHTSLIFLGAQGLGKSEFLRRLSILPELTATAYIRPGDKDVLIMLAEHALIVLDDLDNSPPEIWSYLKSIMTLPFVTVRRPYGRVTERLPRRASFCGSTNKFQILGDSTGSRRFLCVEVEQIDYEAVTPDLMKKVYSQANALLEQGFQYWFDPSEAVKIDSSNQEFYEPNCEEEAVSALYSVPPDNKLDGADIFLLMNTEIAAEVRQAFKGIRIVEKKIGQALRKLGFQRKMTSDHRYKYMVLRLSLPGDDSY